MMAWRENESHRESQDSAWAGDTKSSECRIDTISRMQYEKSTSIEAHLEVENTFDTQRGMQLQLIFAARDERPHDDYEK